MKRFFLWLGVVVVIVIAVFGLVKLSNPRPQSQPTILTDTISENDWVAGNNQATTTLVEYSDFQCPACAAYHPLIQELLRQKGDSFRFAYRHFPLPQHPIAKPAAYAAEAAGRQGQFWEMHDLIFDHQTDWVNARNTERIFTEYATSLGLNINQFAADYRLAEVKEKVAADWQSGLNAGVNSTPTFFLNGERIQPRNLQEFIELIKQANDTSS